jgi:hypothetical protein
VSHNQFPPILLSEGLSRLAIDLPAPSRLKYVVVISTAFSKLILTQSDVRVHARRLMGRKSPDAPLREFPTLAEVEFFEKTSKRGPTLERFRVSLAGRLASAWNKRAAEVFAESFVGSGWYRCQDTAFVQRTFKTHLIQLRNLYNVQQSLQTEGTEADDELAQALSDKGKNMSRNARRRYVCAQSFNLSVPHANL